MVIKSKESALEKWIRKRCMTTNRFTEIVGCSRTVVWKVKRGIPISPYFAQRIVDITDGEIIPNYGYLNRPTHL